MAATKKATAPKTENVKAEVKKAAEKVVEKAATVKAEDVKAEVKKAAEKVAEKAATVKAEDVKAEVKKAAGKVAEKATTAKTAVKKAAKKAEIQSAVYVQFAGKSYAQEDLMKMAKDVWKYDLKQKVSALESVELYVKPEENMVYYVMNKEFTGSFYI